MNSSYCCRTIVRPDSEVKSEGPSVLTGITRAPYATIAKPIETNVNRSANPANGYLSRDSRYLVKTKTHLRDYIN